MACAIIISKPTQRTKSIETVNYPSIKINEVLPFRIRFTEICIPSAYPGVPGIGLQIIGISNYIL